jgi:hypothetical protein
MGLSASRASLAMSRILSCIQTTGNQHAPAKKYNASAHFT